MESWPEATASPALPLNSNYKEVLIFHIAAGPNALLLGPKVFFFKKAAQPQESFTQNQALHQEGK